MFLSNISVLDATILAGLGYGIVFVGLIALLAVVVIMSKIFVAIENKKAKQAEAAPAAVEEVPAEPAAPTAPGSAGGIKLYDVQPKTAAMVMAIVADSLGKPLNELRFISIKEVK